MNPPPGFSARFAAVVAAAGASRRMGDGGKKEYRTLSGMPVLARSVLPFTRSGLFYWVVITVPKGDVPMAKDLLSAHLELDRVCFVEGGNTRQQSVLFALEALEQDPPDFVLIHDGARPWVSVALIERVLRVTARDGACVPLVEAVEAMKQVENEGRIVRHLHRDGVRAAQTPQGFAFGKILAAHRSAARTGTLCVDDAEVFDMYEGPVASVDGETSNRKITFSGDLRED